MSGPKGKKTAHFFLSGKASRVRQKFPLVGGRSIVWEGQRGGMEGNLNCYRKRARTDPAPLADDAGEAGDANARKASCQRLKPQRTKHHPGACRMIPAKLGMQKLPFAPRPKSCCCTPPNSPSRFNSWRKRKIVRGVDAVRLEICLEEFSKVVRDAVKYTRRSQKQKIQNECS